MKMICAPSQVMREGRDLNQHGQAGRQEQASSSSPVTFHETLLAASAALPGMSKATMPHAIATETTNLLNLTSFINFFLSLKRCHHSLANLILQSEWSISKAPAPMVNGVHAEPLT